MQKLFEAVIEIRNGEYTYDYHKLIYSETYEDAVNDFKDYYSNFYGEGYEQEPDVWYFRPALDRTKRVSVALKSVEETTVEEWKQKEFERVLLEKDI